MFFNSLIFKHNETIIFRVVSSYYITNMNNFGLSLSPKRVLGYGIYVKLIKTNDYPESDDKFRTVGKRCILRPNIFGKLYNWFQKMYLIYWGDVSIPYSENWEHDLIAHNIQYKLYLPKGDKQKQIILQNDNMVAMKLALGDNFENPLGRFDREDQKQFWIANIGIIKP